LQPPDRTPHLSSCAPLPCQVDHDELVCDPPGVLVPLSISPISACTSPSFKTPAWSSMPRGRRWRSPSCWAGRSQEGRWWFSRVGLGRRPRLRVLFGQVTVGAFHVLFRRVYAVGRLGTGRRPSPSSASWAPAISVDGDASGATSPVARKHLGFPVCRARGGGFRDLGPGTARTDRQPRDGSRVRCPSSLRASQIPRG
jgi:hypothetical protein